MLEIDEMRFFLKLAKDLARFKKNLATTSLKRPRGGLRHCVLGLLGETYQGVH